MHSTVLGLTQSRFRTLFHSFYPRQKRFLSILCPQYTELKKTEKGRSQRVAVIHSYEAAQAE